MSSSPVQITEFRFAEASDEQWRRLTTLLQQAAREQSPDEPVANPTLLRKSIEAISREPHADLHHYLAIQNDVAVGRLALSIPAANHPGYEDNKHVASADIFVSPDARRRGVGRILLQKAFAECQAHSIALIQGDSMTMQGNAFAENFGGVIGSLVKEMRLQLDSVDWSLLEQWVAEGKANNWDVIIETFEGLISDDDEEIAQYARLYTEVANQIPYSELEGTDKVITAESVRLEDQEHRNIGFSLWTKISREADGSMSGLTEITYHPARGFRATQGLTGVQEQYREHGLGKLLKADMLLFIRERYPEIEYIRTITANVNAPMLSINERLGYAFHNQRTVYKLTVP
jgi:GNAT superfamily N-acetyltransferase